MAILFIPIYRGVLGRKDTGRVRPNWARHTGLQKDYPNRLVRRASGLTLGQRSERPLIVAIAEMYLQGVSTRRVIKIQNISGFGPAADSSKPMTPSRE